MTTETAVREREILGHPAGLYILFFAEMWERFCFYGMRTLLVLYMVSEFMYGDDKAYGVYGAYLALVYLSPIAGGYIADSMIGYRWAVTLGGVIIALGEFSLLVVNEQFFYMGLAAIIVGNGFFKPNISTIVGKLYKDGDPRRDSGFTIFYMGINVGAFISTLVCGYIGERYGWTKGFLLAGIGMLLGLVTFWWGQKFLHGHGNPPSPERFKKTILPVVIGSIVAIPLIYFLLYHQTPYEVPILSSAIGALSQDFAAQPVVGWLLLVTVVGVLGYLFIDALKEDKVQRDRMFVILVLWVFHSLFWAFFEQAGSSLTLFTARNVDRMIGGWEFPTTWGQSFNPLFIMIFALPFAALWPFLSRRKLNPSIPNKFALGVLQVGLGFGVLVFAATVAGDDGKTGLTFLILCYLLHTTGELCLSPVGLSMITKLAPARMTGMVMGAWFLSIAAAQYFAAILAKLTGGASGNGGESLPAVESLPIYTDVFSLIMWLALGAAVLLFLLSFVVKHWLHGVE